MSRRSKAASRGFALLFRQFDTVFNVGVFAEPGEIVGVEAFDFRTASQSLQTPRYTLSPFGRS